MIGKSTKIRMHKYKFGNVFCESDKVEAIYEIKLKVSPFGFYQIHFKHSQTRTNFEGKRH